MPQSKYQGYIPTNVGNIPGNKLERLAAGVTVNLTPKEMHGNKTILLHPENHRKVEAAKRSQKGARLCVTKGEIEHDIDYHSTNGLQGGSFWNGLKTVWNVIGKPIASAALDGIAQAGQSTLNGFVPGIGDVVAPALRQGVKTMTGVGVKGGKLVKGSAAAREHMARIRSMRSTKHRQAGSFRL